MRTDIDYIISLMKKHTPTGISSDLGEQEDSASSGGGTSSGGSTYPSVTKWETGLTRGPANQIGLTKWGDIVKLNRGKANTLL